MSNKLGDIIRDARIKKGYKMGDLAKEIGVTQQSIKYYEKGVFTPNTVKLNKLAQVLELDFDSLYDLRQEMKGD